MKNRIKLTLLGLLFLSDCANAQSVETRLQAVIDSISVDLYGGGGIACTTSDLANFVFKLFNGEVIKDTTVFNLIFTEIPTKDAKPSNYYLGLSSSEYQGLKAYGHSGFWGTVVLYFPD